jgi:hypothetical protein
MKEEGGRRREIGKGYCNYSLNSLNPPLIFHDYSHTHTDNHIHTIAYSDLHISHITYSYSDGVPLCKPSSR